RSGSRTRSSWTRGRAEPASSAGATARSGVRPSARSSLSSGSCSTGTTPARSSSRSKRCPRGRASRFARRLPSGRPRSSSTRSRGGPRPAPAGTGVSTRCESTSARSRSLRRVIVAHLDLDAFFAAVEELEAPELRRKPLVVGGDPHGRGVVATANYEARRFGIHSAMSAAEALRRCPQAVFLRPRHQLYRAYSRTVWDTVRGVVPTVERTGLDEGYLAM